jgi:malate synthase
MTARVDRFGLQVDAALERFISTEALPGTGVATDVFWQGFSSLVHELAPVNRSLLAKRDDFGQKIDTWCRDHAGATTSAAQEVFLREIGYIVAEPGDFTIDTSNVDPEISSLAGPQLVVPVTNARYALNAANARWGSLYDCFYGTDAISGPPPKGGYDRGRGARVVARVRVFLDEAFPIEGTSHADARRYAVKDGILLVDDMPLMQPEKFVGYRGNPRAPDSVLLRNNGLHVELVFDRAHFIGSRDQALLADVVIESAVSAIMDCEDSVACVDAADKIGAYANWLGLMKGNLEASLDKGGKAIVRKLNADRSFVAPNGTPLVLKGRALLWIRNVGHLMTTPAILDRDGAEVPEGLMDAMITTLVGMHDLKKKWLALTAFLPTSKRFLAFLPTR